MSKPDEIRSAAYSRWHARSRPTGDDWADWLAADRKIDRYLYHSFPRRRESDVDGTIQKGIAILDMMVRFGLLVTPEVHELTEEIANPARKLTTLIVQQRICFTDLHPSEVAWHSDEFGWFTLEFEVDYARALGAMPVLYFNHSDDGGSWYAKRLLAHLAFVRERLLWQLRRLGEAVVQAGNNPNISVPLSSTCSITANQAASVLDYLGTAGDFDPAQLEASIRLSSCLWSPAENLRYNSLLGYYRQREWRIAPGLMRTGLQFEDLPQAMRTQLLKLDPAFFDKEIKTGPNEKKKRIDACQVLREIDGRHVLSQVKRIMVPCKCVDDVRSLLASMNPDIRVISIESLW